MWYKFTEKLHTLQTERQTNLGIFLNPRLEKLPLPISRFDDPFFPFSKAIINATQDLVCAYVFDFAAFLSLGAAGAVALERSIRYVGAQNMAILHAPFIGKAYSAMADKTGLGLDALTLANADDLTHYLEHPPYAAFISQISAYSVATLPAQGGIFWENEHKLSLYHQEQLLEIQLIGDDMLYQSRLDDFAESVRESLKALKS